MEVVKLLYIVVEDDQHVAFRYTRHVLHNTLQLMGCKPRHAFKISQRVFEIMRAECLGETLAAMGVIKAGKENNQLDEEGGSIPFESYKRRTTVVVKRRRFIDVVCDALAEYKYVGPKQRDDLVLACRYLII
ncbi:hypothetical protein HanRHA438_Chr00c59g0859751 [Helianthus annuus]|nr:hypothetical protein HanRHA438_Chr00c59g0859751 [Helianthus annuus]